MTKTAPTLSSLSARKRARRRRNEGAVMLVVMLILMIATAGASIAVQATASELNAAGQERIGLQARYTSEAAMMTTITWVDLLGNSNQLLEVWEFWARQPTPPASFPNYAEPTIPIGSNRHHAMRSTMEQQQALHSPGEIPPLSMPASGSGGAPALAFIDPTGSFGPRQAYSPQAEGYVVDMNDCAMAPAGLTPGAPAGGGPGGGLRIAQFYCVLNAHVRIGLQTPSGITDDWNFGAVTYSRDAFANDHDSRATILTPEMLIAGE